MSPVSDLSDKAQRDYKLVKEAISGDQKAYTKLMGLYRDPIFFMMKRMVQNIDDAEDLTIEAFGKAFKMLEYYTPKYAFSTWLFKIASNHCIDFLRKQNKYKVLSIDESINDEDSVPGENIRAETLDPEEEMIKVQKDNLLQDFIKKLHPDYQEILELKYFYGLSYIEIAEQLNIPLGTVKARLFRSKELLLTTIKSGDYNF
ncbi:MAG: sigma-70 family RNA polymerase sigma factor [Bacteroidales bacterium]|nr:sigma-70 family RNA polymerase sigma factor [Bacteroidales bacterium]